MKKRYFGLGNEMDKVLELTGEGSGHSSMLLVGVHGNEKCGIKALENILPTLNVENGRVLIAYGNPRAITQDVRFTEANLNRMFKPDSFVSEEERRSYEYRRAVFLKDYLNQTDVLLDIHASFPLKVAGLLSARKMAMTSRNHFLSTLLLPVLTMLNLEVLITT